MPLREITRLLTIKDEGLKSQVVYSKQPKLGLTQEFVVDCAHALWVVHSIKRLVSLMLLKWFLSDSFIYFMYLTKCFNRLVMCMDAVACLATCTHRQSPYPHHG